MANQKGNIEKKLETVTVAIDKDKGSQFALKWAVDNLLARGKNVTLLHINPKPSPIPSHVGNSDEELMKTFKSPDNQSKEFFLPFRCFCTRKDIKVTEVIADEMDIAKAICDYVRLNLVETLILGAPTRNAFVRRFKSVDIPTAVTKSAAEFCTIYIIAKGKVSSVRSASACMPNGPPRAYSHNQNGNIRNPIERVMQPNQSARALDRSQFAACPSPTPSHFTEDLDIKSPFTRAKNSNKSYGELSILPDTDISFVSSGRPSTDRMFASFGDDIGAAPRLSSSSDTESRISFGSSPFGGKPMDGNHLLGSFCGSDAGSVAWSHSQDDVEAEMRRLKQELKQTMDMYSTACREALNAKQKAMELHRWKKEEQQRLEEARLAEEAALAIAEKEKAKCRVAIEAAEAAKKLAEMEAQRRISAEMKAHKEAEERKKVLDSLAHNDVRYRRYGIDEIESATEFFATNRKIGEGGYGPVYRCYLDHTPVAIKVLRPDAAQGRSQFQQEVEVLSCIRHPNMVLLLGACPEYGCLVYEYMANGSLEDRLFRRGNTPVLPWQIRFRIAAEIGTGLLFLHQTKPEPLVHRDLKPGNILLDRNCVSKISDVGLARLVPPSVADTVTQYRMTSTAGTFCYIDPEYQQTGMLGTKSDIYSLGILLLQIITAKPPMGLTHHVERSIEKGKFADMLDPEVHDWPVEEALKFAKLSLKCAQMRKKDRPDLAKVVLPELNRLRMLAEETMPHYL